MTTSAPTILALKQIEKELDLDNTEVHRKIVILILYRVVNKIYKASCPIFQIYLRRKLRGIVYFIEMKLGNLTQSIYDSEN